MRLKPWRVFGAALVTVAAQTAVAENLQTDANPSANAEASRSADDITVTGRKLSPKEYHEKVASFVRDTGVAAGMRPAARWVQPACFRAMGLSDEQGAYVEGLLGRVAAEVGVPVAKRPCDTNIAVTFTGDAKGVVKAIQKRSPLRLAETSAVARAALVEGDAPVRWWYTTDRVSRFGTSRGEASPRMTLDAGAGGTSLPGSDIPTIQHYTSSVVSSQVVRSLQTATVVIDVTKAAGLSLEALASYAALVAFAEINARDAAPDDSILAALKPGGPRELTEIDLAFLRALYRLPLDREALAQRGLLVDRMINREE